MKEMKEQLKGFVLPKKGKPKDAFDRIKKLGWENGQRTEFLKMMIDDPDWRIPIAQVMGRRTPDKILCAYEQMHGMSYLSLTFFSNHK